MLNLLTFDFLHPCAILAQESEINSDIEGVNGPFVSHPPTPGARRAMHAQHAQQAQPPWDRLLKTMP